MKKALKILSIVSCFYMLLMAIRYFSYSSAEYASANNYDDIQSIVDLYGFTVEEAEAVYKELGTMYLLLGVGATIAAPLDFFIFRLVRKDPIEARWKFVTAGVITACTGSLIVGILSIVYGVIYGSHNGNNKVVDIPPINDNGSNESNPYDYQY